MFTKRHYEAIAEVMLKTKPLDWSHIELWDEVVTRLLELFHKDNYNFDPDKFMKACNGN